MKPVALAVLAVAVLAFLLALPGGAPRAQEAVQNAQSTIVATIDLSPIQRELASLRAEMAALRQAVADPKGIRDEVAQATAAAKSLDARLAELTALAKQQAELLKPLNLTFDPATVWEYQCLRARSETVANRLARDGWQLVTASNDWLFFRRPLPASRRNEPIREPARGEE
ncbi:MAG TPA: hypothetical protein PLE19_15210 [Planctomycetota bacterium]|nr:hypothetical protein [Planctomycetota bacterium]HRR81642.1 hypothetical protein [Planctomycetota bacterium]HRT93692.1 hypothetical protein [Planctomycetota bacterium]